MRFLPENPNFIPEINCRLWPLLRYRDRKKQKYFPAVHNTGNGASG
nr:MAG TPA: hypothetical protein [Caudoviricetes sp.]